MSRWSPLGAFCAGLAAGAVGSLAQSLFFAATKRLAPAPPEDAFRLAEPEQRNEAATDTVARRVVEDLAKRGPLRHPRSAGTLVHFAFGSGWGAAYGLLAGSLEGAATLRGGVTFGSVVCIASDDVLLPMFRLAGWPQRYPAQSHLYALAAHAVYGATTALSFKALDRMADPATALLASMYLTRRLPRWVRPSARRLTARGLRMALPVRRLAAAW